MLDFSGFGAEGSDKQASHDRNAQHQKGQRRRMPDDVEQNWIIKRRLFLIAQALVHPALVHVGYVGLLLGSYGCLPLRYASPPGYGSC